MYRLRKEARAVLRHGATLTFTGPGLRPRHVGTIVGFTAGMYDKADEMYDVRFEGEDHVRYILFSDPRRL